jgi:hypothetical protein
MRTSVLPSIAVTALLLTTAFSASPARANLLQLTPYLGVDAMVWDVTADDTLWRNFRIEESDVINPEFSSTGVRFRGGLNILRYVAWKRMLAWVARSALQSGNSTMSWR